MPKRWEHDLSPVHHDTPRNSTTQNSPWTTRTQTNVSYPHILLHSRWTLIAPFHAVINDLFAAVEEKNGGRLTPDQLSRVSLKLGEMLGTQHAHEVNQNEKGQVRRVLFCSSVSDSESDIN